MQDFTMVDLAKRCVLSFQKLCFERVRQLRILVIQLGSDPDHSAAILPIMMLCS